ncbi:MAG: alanine--tRNA ligase [bacterium]
MSANELRKKFLDFMKEKGHAVIPSAPLIPEHDPTVLFTTAGMHPLVPYLLGQSHPAGKRLADAQKCIRTTDIDDVGDNRHLTFFEMLGNWSLGDYFKKEAIEWSWEFLTDKKWLGLEPQRLYISVFMGDENSPIDQESIDAWKTQFAKAGINAEVCAFGTTIAGNENFRIFPLPAKDNWWGPAGQTGPCGPDTEMFYDVSPDLGALQKTFGEEADAGRIMEVWNDVFMEFNKTEGGTYEKLSQQNVDTGMGLERTISVLNGKTDTFDNELFYPIFEKTEELSGKKHGETLEITRAVRIVADHIKAATFILAEGLEPSNVERGYVLRRLIRRAVRYGKQLGISEIFTFKVADVVIEMYRNVYPELHNNRAFIEERLVREEEKFVVTLDKALKFIEKIKEGDLTGKLIFDFYQTYGFPYEMTKEYFEHHGYWSNDKKLREEFNLELIRHQELSRAGAEQKFKGGLADHSEQVVKYHTTAHLMLEALRQVFGNHVTQKGSNITAERLRFDFSHPQKVTPEEIKKVEEIVNEQIMADLPVAMKEMGLDEAKAKGAMGVFESKYGERVKVYSIGNFSREICGGPHVERTSALGRFKIVKEEASSAGVRRIKAVLE